MLMDCTSLLRVSFVNGFPPEAGLAPLRSAGERENHECTFDVVVGAIFLSSFSAGFRFPSFSRLQFQYLESLIQTVGSAHLLM